MNHYTGSTNEKQLQSIKYSAVMPHILQRLTKIDTQLDYLVKNAVTKEDIMNLKGFFASLRNWVLAIVGGGIILLLTICWLAAL